MPFDLELSLTRAARQALPLARRRGLHCAFDFRGPAVELDGADADLRCAAHRLFCALLDIMDSGAVVFEAEAAPLDGTQVALRLRLASAGRLAAPSTVSSMLRRLGLSEVDPPGPDRFDGVRRARGTCPRTGLGLWFACEPGQGALFVLEGPLRLSSGWPLEADTAPDAGRARAWVVDGDVLAAQSLGGRLQRLGWAVSHLTSPAQALRQIHQRNDERRGSEARGPARPALVVVQDTPDQLDTLQALRQQLPPWTQCLYAAPCGAAPAASDPRLAGWRLGVLPLCPAELRQATALLSDERDEPSGLTAPAPLLVSQRPTLLLVDDLDINRLVGRGLARALGYDVRTAHDGHDAITQCVATPPDVVLMDLHMPHIDGLQATRALRALQHAGELPPFPVVALTADTGAEARAACTLAGMDGFLSKPVMLDSLRAELARLSWMPIPAA